MIKDRKEAIMFIANKSHGSMEDVNRIKLVLAEKKRTNKWL